MKRRGAPADDQAERDNKGAEWGIGAEPGVQLLERTSDPVLAFAWWDFYARLLADLQLSRTARLTLYKERAGGGEQWSLILSRPETGRAPLSGDPAGG